MKTSSSSFGPTEKRLVLAAFQVLLEGFLGVQILAAAAGYPCHQQMLILWHACFFVVHHRMVAIEGEAVLHVAAHTKDGDRLIGGGDLASRSASGRAE